jgi:hypothetical protein
VNPCSSYYTISGYHSANNPFQCATTFDPPTCGGLPTTPSHTLSYQNCPYNSSSCEQVLGNPSSNAHLIMYVQYNPKNAGCTGSTIAFAAPCQKDDIGRPTVGFMNWCSAADLELTSTKLQAHIEVGVHEVWPPRDLTLCFGRGLKILADPGLA